MSTSTPLVASTTTRTPLVITSFPSIPLTTTFTPSASDCGGIQTGAVLIINGKKSCLPPRFTTASSFFYSPGIACPSGYWTACHDTTGVASITTVTCCPTYGDIRLSCVKDPLSLSSVWETLFCTWIAPQSPGTVVTVTRSDNGRTSTVTEPVTSPGGINAYGVKMVYEASDLPTSSSTTTGSPTPGATGAPSPATTDSPPSQSSPALSTGAIAAIGVVVPLVVIGALAAAILLWRRRRQASAAAAAEEKQSSAPLTPSQQDGAAVAGAGHDPKYYYAGSMPQQPLLELPSTRAAAELPGESAPLYGR